MQKHNLLKLFEFCQDIYFLSPPDILSFWPFMKNILHNWTCNSILVVTCYILILKWLGLKNRKIFVNVRTKNPIMYRFQGLDIFGPEHIQKNSCYFFICIDRIFPIDFRTAKWLSYLT